MRHLTAALGLAICFSAGSAIADTAVSALIARFDNNRQCLIFDAISPDGTADFGNFAVPLSLKAANTPPLVTSIDELLGGHASQANVIVTAAFAHRTILFHPVDPVNCGPYGMVPRASDPDFVF